MAYANALAQLHIPPVETRVWLPLVQHDTATRVTSPTGKRCSGAHPRYNTLARPHDRGVARSFARPKRSALQIESTATFADTSWIRLGQAMRSKLSTEAAERRSTSDATQVIAEIDMPRVLAYAVQHGRGVIVYVNRVALEQQLDELLPLYASWGVQGIKRGFMDGRTQAGIRFTHKIVQKAATYQLLVDVHDSYRPSGLSRTYPNLLTQEGIRGNEHFPAATHNVTLPFTRFLAGAADYTFPYYSNQGTTRAHHTVTIARRKGQAWFVGTLTNQEARTVKIPLTFLDPHQQYTAYHYQDQTPTQVAIDRSTVTTADTISAALLPSGGHVLYLAPAPMGE